MRECLQMTVALDEVAKTVNWLHRQHTGRDLVIEDYLVISKDAVLILYSVKRAMDDYPPHHPSYRQKGYLPNFARASRPDLKHERKAAMATRHHKGKFDADWDVVQLGDTFEDLPVLDFQAMNKKANADGLMADVERI